MTIADLVDGGFAVIKSRPRTIVLCSLAVVLPIQILLAWSQRNLLGGAALGDLVADPTLLSTADDGGGDSGYLGALLQSLGVSIIAVGVMTIISGRYAGSDPTTGQVLRTMVRRAPVLLVAWIIVHVIQFIGLFAVGIGALYAMGALLVTAPIVATEGLGPFAAVRRSWDLTASRRWPMVGVGLLSWLIVGTLGWILALVPTFAALVIGTRDGWMLLAVGNSAVGLLTMPLTAAITCLAYLDLRVRSEGLDVEMDALAAFERAN